MGIHGGKLKSLNNNEPSTVEGELSVANFIDNFFKRAPLPDIVAVHPCLVVPKGTASTNY